MTTSIDTFDTLKYGHIPTDVVISTMKETYGDTVMDDFDFNTVHDEISFIQFIPVKYDNVTQETHGFMISCYILQPDEDSDKICFTFDLDTSTDELSLPDYMNTFVEINKRSDIIDLRMKWQEFISLCFLEILKYYKENENTVDYNLPLMLSDIAEDICHFCSKDLT